MKTSKDEVIAAIRSYFGDTSRSRIETLEGMSDIIDEAQSHYDMLDTEINEEPDEG